MDSPNEIDVKLLIFLKNQGCYYCITPVKNRGFCAITPMLFGDWDLVHGLDWYGIKGRYRYDSLGGALDALFEWSGTGDPSGNWSLRIKNPTYDPGV